MKPAYVYAATVTRVIDGDSLEVTIDLGFKIAIRETVRIYGIDTPELNSIVPGERDRAKAAKEDVAALLAMAGANVTVRSHKGGSDKYGRYLCEVFLSNGQSLGDLLIEHGHAKPYDGGRR